MGTKETVAQNVYVNCNEFNGDLKAKCLRKQIKLLQQQVKELEKYDTQVRDTSRKVDCSFQAAQISISAPYKLTIDQRAQKLIISKTIKEAAGKSFRDDASCFAWIKDRARNHFDYCQKWLDRNNVQVFKAGIPYTSNRGYLDSPARCEFNQPKEQESGTEAASADSKNENKIKFNKIEFDKIEFKKIEIQPID